MEAERSDIVEALCGRDRGGYFFVLETDGDYALLADGKRRKVERPKRKKQKHIRLAARTESRVAAKLRSGGKVLNSELRRELAAFCQKSQSQNQGGQ